jgi:AAA+ ATPase superfamily predicted ATPase
MSQQKFVDRKEELEFLEERYKTDSSEFIVLYGRRRVGKTELLLKFIENKKGVYLLASTEGDRQNIKDFSKVTGRFIGNEKLGAISFDSWQSFFENLFKHKAFDAMLKKEKIVMIIDEFPFLIHGNKDIPSIFHKIWELIMKRENIMLVLSGSAVAVMESEVLNKKSPLYGRRTGQWQLQPLHFSYLKEFLPYSFEELAMVWYVTGGIPAYLPKFSPKLSFWENIQNAVLKKGTYLYTEAELLLNDEFREPKNYKLIFKAIAIGCHTLGEICNNTGLDKSMVSKYIDVLKGLHIVREEIPVTASRKFKKRLYFISDPYFNFWFRYVYPNKIDLEAGRSEEITALVKKDFSDYAGPMFEVLVDELIRTKYVLKQFSFSEIGRWWHKDVEIDIVGLNEAGMEIVFAECKWQSLSHKDAEKVLFDLQGKSKHVDWNIGKRKEYYAIFAKRIEGKDALRKSGFLVWDLEDYDS